MRYLTALCLAMMTTYASAESACPALVQVAGLAYDAAHMTPRAMPRNALLQAVNAHVSSGHRSDALRLVRLAYTAPSTPKADLTRLARGMCR